MEKYYDNTERIPANSNIIYCINKLKPAPGKAIDIGCGAGRDTKYLLKHGWSVIAIDKADLYDRISKYLTKEAMERFQFSKQEFENLKLENADLIVANFSLSFCKKDKFYEMWDKIVENINENGYFVGNFFVINYEWKDIMINQSFFTKEQVENLFDKFNIIKFDELEKDALTGEGKMKHWHYFSVIAQKKSL
jgi:SAM-dependent methyltransferase